MSPLEMKALSDRLHVEAARLFRDYPELEALHRRLELNNRLLLADVARLEASLAPAEPEE